MGLVVVDSIIRKVFNASMVIKKLIWVGLFIIASISTGHAEQNGDWQPSRKAWTEYGCVWEAYIDDHKGLKLWYQNCSQPSAHYVLSWNNDILEQHRPSDDVKFGSSTVLEMYTKPVQYTIEQAIADQFISKSEKAERDNCRVVKDDTPPARPGVEYYRIIPTDSYEKLVIEAFNKKNPNGGIPYDTICGEHGKWASGDAYFEYHPIEAPNRFLFVVVGQDEPLFDEKSIVISNK